MSISLSKIVTKTANSKSRKFIKCSVEQEKALRDQLHIEIENKTKACSNPTYNCSIPRLDGYEYCIRHILQDTRAPYKQCAFIYPSNGKKCTQAAPKHDNKKEAAAASSAFTNYCFEHSRLVQLNKTHEIIGQYKQVETNEAYLNDLTHHIKIDKHDSPPPSQFATDTDEEIDVVSSNVEPFINYVHVAKFDSKNELKGKRILDYASDSSTDDDVPTINNTWKGHEWDNSDAESVDSQNEDFLKHAGIFTTEEATMIAKQKMMRLQTLYTEQIQRLQYLLKEKRRKYLQSIRKERETLCSIHDQPKDTPEERRLYEKLKALNHYHKRHGIEAVLQKKYHERRLKASEGANLTHKGPLYTKCIFTEGGVKCGERALPCCKYCKKHILEDKKQILFRACGVEKSGIVCQEPVPNIFEDATCVLHINFPVQRTYTQKKFESETEEDDDDNSGCIKKSTIKMEEKISDDNNTTVSTSVANNNDGDENSHLMAVNTNNNSNKNNINNNNNNNIEKMEVEVKGTQSSSLLKSLKNEKENKKLITENNNDDVELNLKKESTSIMNDNEDEDVEMPLVNDVDNNITIAHDQLPQQNQEQTTAIITSKEPEDSNIILSITTDTNAEDLVDSEKHETDAEESKENNSSSSINVNSNKSKNQEEILLEIVTENE